jgi:hypothetical protein
MGLLSFDLEGCPCVRVVPIVESWQVGTLRYHLNGPAIFKPEPVAASAFSGRFGCLVRLLHEGAARRPRETS